MVLRLRYDISIVAMSLAVFLGVALVSISQRTAVSQSESRNEKFLLPPKHLKHFTLGYSEVVADSIWLRVIQDFDFCESQLLDKTAACHADKGWVYHMIESITELAPNFRDPYIYGGLMLSILINDTQGASLIFDKGVARHPTDWILSYRAAYHAMSEEKNDEKAARLLRAAADNGAPKWLYSLAARLSQKLGRLDLARTTVADALDRSTDKASAEYFTKRLAEIDAQIAEENAKQKH